jgi:hypothetical protein
MKKLLLQLDTDPLPSVFDAVVAYDGGADHLLSLPGVTPQNVGSLVEGAIYTRPPKQKKNTAIFIGGSDLAAGQNLLNAVKQQFFSNFRVSVMLDSNGCNTTAAAAVALLAQADSLAGQRAVVLAGTGPIGQRAGVLLAQEGAEVVLTSRRHDRAAVACQRMNEQFGVTLKPAQAASDEEIAEVLAGAQVVFGAGKAGIQLLKAEQWQAHPSLNMMADVNTAPPLGFAGIEMSDKDTLRHGKRIFGGLGIGSLKLRLHRACIARLFESNKHVLDAPEIYALAKAMLA